MQRYALIEMNTLSNVFCLGAFRGLSFSSVMFNTSSMSCANSHHTEAVRAISFKIYCFSCESFPWNCKLSLSSKQAGTEFANPESQTSLRLLIYLPMSSQVFFLSSTTCWEENSCNDLIENMVSKCAGRCLR